jgi:hypothetical protein
LCEKVKRAQYLCRIISLCTGTFGLSYEYCITVSSNQKIPGILLFQEIFRGR